MKNTSPQINLETSRVSDLSRSSFNIQPCGYGRTLIFATLKSRLRLFQNLCAQVIPHPLSKIGRTGDRSGKKTTCLYLNHENQDFRRLVELREQSLRSRAYWLPASKLEALIPRDFSPDDSPHLATGGQKPRLRSTSAAVRYELELTDSQTMLFLTTVVPHPLLQTL